MGGKPWSKQEETIFWRIIARQAPPGLGENRRSRRTANQARNWAGLATRMGTLMRAAVPMTRHRKYNSIGLYEHYHHNYIRNKGSNNGKYSPNAYKFVKEYEAWLNQTGGAASNGSSNAATAPQLAAQPARLQQTLQASQAQAQAQAQAQVQAQAQAQAQTQTQSMYAPGFGAQGVMYFNRPMPPPPTHSNVGYVLPNQDPGYHATQHFGNAGPAPNVQPFHNGSTVVGGHSFNNAGPAPNGQLLHNGSTVVGGRSFNNTGPTPAALSFSNAGPVAGGQFFNSAGPISNGQPLHNGSTVVGGHSFNNAGPTPNGQPLHNGSTVVGGHSFSYAGPTPIAGGQFFNSAGPASSTPSFNNGSTVSGGPSFGNARVGSNSNPTQVVSDDQSRSFDRNEDGSARSSSQ